MTTWFIGAGWDDRLTRGVGLVSVMLFLAGGCVFVRVASTRAGLP